MFGALVNGRFVSNVDAKMHLRFGSKAMDPGSVGGDIKGKQTEG